MQQSGGLLLTPVRKLVATLIFAKGKNANQVLSSAPKIGDPRQRVADFTYSLFTIHSSLKIKADFWKVISNSE